MNKCEACGYEQENVENTCGAETNYTFMMLCDTCQELLYNKHYGIVPKSGETEEGL